MTRVPGIDENLTDEAKAPYAHWLDAVLARAEHLHDCRACARPWRPCSSGAALYDAELQRRQEFHDARHHEAQP